MVVKTFKARKGSSLNDSEAAIAGTFLETHSPVIGVLTADAVYALAAPTDSPIHDVGDFDWNKARAAKKWNLHAARRLMNSIMIVEESAGGELVETRAFHRVIVLDDDGATSGYIRERVVWQTPEYAEQVIERAKAEFLSWRDRHQQYRELMEWARTELEAAA